MNYFSSPLKNIFRAFIYCFWIACAANAQVQLGEDLVGTNIGDRFGADLEISDDGNRVIIGAFGYAQVFEWVDGANWNQVGSTFFPPIEDNYFGEVVDIANGGTTVMVANKREDQNGFEQCGSVGVFDWSGSDWQQRGSAMYGSDDNEFFGADAVLSADGLTVVAAANWFGWSDELNMIGQVRRYDWIDGEWVSENGSIDGGNGVQRFGTQLDLSADGLRLVAGGVGAGNGGIVRTYEWTEGGWASSSEDISIPDQIYSDASGMCLSLSADGQTLVVSTTARTNRYEWIDGVGWQLINTWWERAWDLSLSGDGALLSHGNAAGADQWGTLRLMEWENEAWSELSLETGSALNHHFGYSAGISASSNVHGGGAFGEFGFGNETIEGYVRLFGEAPEVLIPGCTDEAACNFDPEATEDDGTCEYPPFGSSDCDLAYDISVETTALAFDEGQGQYVACIGDAITFTAVSDLSSSFELWLWTWSDGTIDTTFSNVYTTDFDEAGFYTFYVEAYGNGVNAFSPPMTVTVSPEPIVDLEVTTPLCVNSLGELSVNSINYPIEVDGLSSNASSNLPDATGVWFENSIVVDDFPADMTLEDCADLVGFNLLIEHSYVGDLTMQIECPNGTTVSLLENNQSQPDACNGDDGDLNSQDLGEPGMGVDIGTGYWYSFTGSGEYVLDDLNISIPSGDYSIPSGEYALCGDICDFEGCPLNGTWTLGILDSWGGDNGYLFEWGIEFTDEFIEESMGGAGFPSVDDALTTGWQWDDEMQNVDWSYTSADSLSMSFSEAGVYPFSYNIVNSFGCSTTVEVDVEVAENDLPEISLDESIEFCDFPVNLEASFNGTESSCASSSGSFSYCYGSNDNQFFTYCPDNPGDGNMLSLSFSSGNIEPFWDQIIVYDGDSELSPILENVDGDLTGLSWIATNPDGCISFSLTSDGWGDCESQPELYSILEWCVSCGDATLCGYDWSWSAEGWESPSNDPSVSIDYLPSNPILISVEATPTANAVCSTSDSIWVIQDSLCAELQNDPCEGLEVYTYNGHTYPVVAIGEHCWFQENLRTTTFRNGDTIPFAEEDTPFWYSQSQPRHGVYQDNDSLGNIAGNLYNYSAVVDSRELCPTGWHVPISTDFLNLVDSLGSSSLQFRAVGLASEETGYWDVDLEGTDETGMSIQPFGARTHIGEDYGWGTTTSLWCASTGLPQSGEGWNFSFTNLSSNLVLRSRGRYVRCVLGEYAYGCTDPDYANYDNGAEFDDGSCESLTGCTDETACNYDPEAEEDNGSCLYVDAVGECGGACEADIDSDGICDIVDPCVGTVDACGICNGPGAIYSCGCFEAPEDADCGCEAIPEGDCDCEGNQLDALGVCGGWCEADTDGNGICDCVEANPDGACGCGVYEDALGVCGGTCTADDDGDGICDCEAAVAQMSAVLASAETASTTVVFETELLNTVTVNMTFGTENGAIPSDLMVSVTAPDGSCVVWGGWNIAPEGDCMNAGTGAGNFWPSSWNSTQNESYEATFDLSGYGLSGSGSWTFELMNARTGNGIGSYDITFTLFGSCCTWDADGDGICDGYDSDCTDIDECGVCDGPGPDALGVCGGDCQSDANGDGICDVFVLIEEGLAPFNQPDWRAAVRDFNNDGLEDVLGFNSNEVQSLGLYLSQGDLTFIDVSESLTAPVDTLISFIDAIDVNKDGLLDMYFASRPAGVSTSNNTYFWYVNSGSGYTRHVVGDNLSFGAILQVANVSSAFVVDYSNDGIPDWVFKVNDTSGKGLMGVRGTLENPLEPWLMNEPEILIPLEFQNILGNPFIDIDDDFDLDFKFVNGSNQYSATQVVHFENDGNGVFTQIEVPGFETARMASFGASGDLNRDGILDFVTGRSDCCVPEGMALHYGNEDGSFITYQNALDYEFNPYIQGGEVIDLDLDGKEDILWTSSATINTTRIFFHHQVEWGQFEEAGEEFGFDFESDGACCPIGQSLSAVTIDVNNDAKPDLMINEAAYIYSTFAPEEGNWQLLNTSPHSGVRVELRACHGMTQGFGARVRGFIDGEWYVHRLGWLPQANSNSIYFGLPNAESLDVLIVDWVGGGQTVLTDIAPGSSLLIFESDECAPAVEECDLSLACGEGTYWEPLVGQCLPSDNCLGDLNGDAVITTSDLLVFLSLFGTVCD